MPAFWFPRVLHAPDAVLHGQPLWRLPWQLPKSGLSVRAHGCCDRAGYRHMLGGTWPQTTGAAAGALSPRLSAHCLAPALHRLPADLPRLSCLRLSRLAWASTCRPAAVLAVTATMSQRSQGLTLLSFVIPCLLLLGC